MKSTLIINEPNTDNSPIHDPPLERVYPEQYLIGGMGVLREAAQAAAQGNWYRRGEGDGNLHGDFDWRKGN